MEQQRSKGRDGRVRVLHGILAVMAAAIGGCALAQTTTVTRTTTFEYDDYGQLIRETIEPGSDPSLTLGTIYNREPTTGVLRSRQLAYRDMQTGANVLRTVEQLNYDPQDRFVLEVINAKQHKETRTYNAGLGALLTMTGPNNLTTTWQYDGWGRKTRADFADGRSETFAYRQCMESCANHATQVLITQYWAQGVQRAVPSEEFLDALGRRVQTRSWGFDGRQVFTQKIFNGKGLLERSSRAYFAGAQQVFAETYYDDLGRPTELRLPADNGGQDVSTTVYQGLRTTSTNAKSQQRVEIRGVLGSVRRLIDARGYSMSFVHDGFNALTRVFDAKGNQTAIDYDLRGRKTQLNDPDLGVRRYWTNALGQTWQQIDAKNQTVTVTFDELGRMTRRLSADQDARWEYDSAAHGVGRLAEAYTWTAGAKDYREVRAYDAVSRPASLTIGLDWDYVTEFAYDGFGRTASTSFRRGPRGGTPGAPHQTLSTEYNAQGYATRLVRDGAAISTTLARDAAGVLTQAQWGNGLIQQWGLNPFTGRLKSLDVGPSPGADSHQRDRYNHDALGNVTSREQRISTGGDSLLEVFFFDELNRLTSSQLAAQPTKFYDYDAIGNLVRKDGIGRLVYPASGSAGPHALSRIDSDQPVLGLTNPQLTYDGNGNLVDGLNRHYAWTTFNGLSSVDRMDGPTAIQRTAFLFGPDRQRVKQTISPMSGGAPGAPSTTIYYAGNVEKEVDAAAGTTTIRTYLPASLGFLEERVASATAQPGDAGVKAVRYFMTDHLGSAVGVVDESGAVLQRMSYDPWGRRRTEAGLDDSGPGFGSMRNTQDHSGYTGQEQLDQVGLVHLNGRVYDPISGRMTSADPTVPDPSNPQAFNRYSYVLNNSLSYVDPSGFLAVEHLYMTDGDFVNGINTSGGGAAQEEEKRELPKVVVEGESNKPEKAGGSVTLLGTGLAMQRPTGTLPRVLIQGVKPLVDLRKLGTGLAAIPEALVLFIIVGPSNFGQPSGRCGPGALCSPDPKTGELVPNYILNQRAMDALNAEALEAGDDPQGSSQGGGWQPPQEATDKIPDEWGDGEPNSGGEGRKYKDPKAPKENIVRIDKGNPDNSQPSQQVDHVVVLSGGKVRGRDGNPINGSIKNDPVNAHIPLSEWVRWSRWDRP
ncbi:RHS repeat domain-containing protein [Roseateles sp. L2-2]|uniref:RHS repeat domain-containing protein n=1 Tax=Roseateles sp. L2-2 TaxID=3422597 RepID=UPI003D3676C4